MAECSLFTISGIIGVGKTTFLRRMEEGDRLARALGRPVVVVYEQTDEWTRNGWLREYYANPGANALAFQVLVSMSHADAMRKARATAPAGAVILVERGVADKTLFWAAQRDKTFLQDVAHAHVSKLVFGDDPVPDGIIHLKTSTLNGSMERVGHRSERGNAPCIPRSDTPPIDQADGVSAEYQQRLLDLHDQWFPSGDACLHFMTDDYDPEDAVAEVASFIQSIKKKGVSCCPPFVVSGLPHAPSNERQHVSDCAFPLCHSEHGHRRCLGVSTPVGHDGVPDKYVGRVLDSKPLQVEWQCSIMRVVPFQALGQWWKLCQPHVSAARNLLEGADLFEPIERRKVVVVARKRFQIGQRLEAVYLM